MSKNEQTVTKQSIVLEHLLKHGSITTWEAIQQYGITRLSAIIYLLRKRYNIKTEKVSFVDRYGNSGIFANYVMDKNNIEVRKKHVANALGVAMIEGRKPSKKAMEISKQYAAGEITAVQAQQIYLKSCVGELET